MEIQTNKRENYELEKIIKLQNPDGSFSDINYNDPALSSWDPLNHISRLLYVCRVYIQPESKYYHRKAIIKISGVFFEDEDINRIALVAPDAKLNIIKDYEVVEKKVVEVPDTIVGIAKCMNPKCITNFEAVTTRFKVVSKKNVSLKCHYCEKITNQ